MVIAAVLPFFGVASVYRRQYEDAFAVEAQDARLEGVRQLVPEGAAVGFITDGGLPGYVAVQPSQFTNMGNNFFYGAQYGLAPRLLEPGTRPEWVLGIFAGPANLQNTGARHGLRLMRHIGPGIALYRNEKP
jgi:hypothetical protein